MTGVTAYVELQALAVRQPEMLPVLLRGIDPAPAAVRACRTAIMRRASSRDLTPGSGRVIVGEVIAERLGLCARAIRSPCWCRRWPRTARRRRGCASSRSPGSSRSGLQDHDATLIFAPLADVRALAPAGTASEGLRLRLQRRAGGAAHVAPRLRARLPPRLRGAATGRRTTPTTFAPSASRRP